jgi:hypothetical protein
MLAGIKKILRGKEGIILLLLLIPVIVFGDIEIDNPINATSVEGLVGALANFVYNIAWALSPLMILIGAFYILTAMGDPKRVSTGKNIILWTIVGIVVLLIAGGLPEILKDLLSVQN